MFPEFETSGKMIAGTRKTSRRPIGGVRRHQSWIRPPIPAARCPRPPVLHPSADPRGLLPALLVARDPRVDADARLRRLVRARGDALDPALLRQAHVSGVVVLAHTFWIAGV